MNRSSIRRALAGLFAAGLAAITAVVPGVATAATSSTAGITDPTALTRELGPDNPFMAPAGVGAMHSDSYSSDAAPQPGPGTGAIQATLTANGTICPTILLDRQGKILAYCVNHSTRQGELSLLDPASLAPLATLSLPPSGQLGGFYMYLDAQDRAVLGDGANHILRITHSQSATGSWAFTITDDWDISGPVTAHCGGTSGCDYVESTTPDFRGLIWFSTAGGVVGTINPYTGATHAITLPAGEQVANSISASPVGVAVPSDHALYLMRADFDGTPYTTSRQPYDRGTFIKPGRLSQGTGTTPVFFGPAGSRYLAITDNNDSQENLLIYRLDAATGDSQLLCSTPLFTPGASAAENAPIGIGNSVAIANTYGYNYHPGQPVVPLPGGLTRIDVRPDESGCDQVWTNPVPSSAVPKLSTVDGNIYTIQRTLTGSTENFALSVIDFATGQTVSTQPLGTGQQWDTSQLAGVSGPDGTLYQGTTAGIAQIRPAR